VRARRPARARSVHGHSEVRRHGLRSRDDERANADALFEGGNYFECPRWRDDRWWVSDFYRRAVFTYEADGREEAVLEVEGQPSGLVWMPDGDLLVVSMKDRRVLRRASDGTVAVHADVSALTGGHLNDMIVDRQGFAYAGNCGDGAPGHAVQVEVAMLIAAMRREAHQAHLQRFERGRATGLVSRSLPPKPADALERPVSAES
jgi:sugar lactone lactonase YvrE